MKNPKKSAAGTITPHQAGALVRDTNNAMQDVERQIEHAHVAILNEAHRVANLIDLLEDIQSALHRLYAVSQAKSIIDDRVAARSEPPKPGSLRPIEPALQR